MTSWTSSYDDSSTSSTSSTSSGSTLTPFLAMIWSIVIKRSFGLETTCLCFLGCNSSIFCCNFWTSWSFNAKSATSLSTLQPSNLQPSIKSTILNQCHNVSSFFNVLRWHNWCCWYNRKNQNLMAFQRLSPISRPNPCCSEPSFDVLGYGGFFAS